MEPAKTLQKRIKPKGKRLNWTPIEEAEKVSLKKMDVSGKKISPKVIQKSKRYIDHSKQLLIS
jgi:hypothetical protein